VALSFLFLFVSCLLTEHYFVWQRLSLYIVRFKSLLINMHIIHTIILFFFKEMSACKQLFSVQKTQATQIHKTAMCSSSSDPGPSRGRCKDSNKHPPPLWNPHLTLNIPSCSFYSVTMQVDASLNPIEYSSLQFWTYTGLLSPLTQRPMNNSAFDFSTRSLSRSRDSATWTLTYGGQRRSTHACWCRAVSS